MNQHFFSIYNNHDTLTPKEALKLFKKNQKGDDVARNRLILSNMRLVVSIANKFRWSLMEFEDLVQEGVLGLIYCIDNKFDHDKGFQFSTYATWWIKQYIQRAVRNKSRTIRIPVHVGQYQRRVNKAIEELTKKLQREPSLMELSVEAKLNKKKVKEVIEANNQGYSLDNKMFADSKATFKDFIENESYDFLQSFITDRNGFFVRNMMKDKLSNREYDILALRMGIENNGNGLTFEQIGQIFKLSRERIRQIEKKALEKLKFYMKIKKFKHGDFF